MMLAGCRASKPAEASPIIYLDWPCVLGRFFAIGGEQGGLGKILISEHAACGLI